MKKANKRGSYSPWVKNWVQGVGEEEARPWEMSWSSFSPSPEGDGTLSKGRSFPFVTLPELLSRNATTAGFPSGLASHKTTNLSPSVTKNTGYRSSATGLLMPITLALFCGCWILPLAVNKASGKEWGHNKYKKLLYSPRNGRMKKANKRGSYSPCFRKRVQGVEEPDESPQAMRWSRQSNGM